MSSAAPSPTVHMRSRRQHSSLSSAPPPLDPLLSCLCLHGQSFNELPEVGSLKVPNLNRRIMWLALMSILIHLIGSMTMMVGRNASAAKLVTHRSGPTVNEASLSDQSPHIFTHSHGSLLFAHDLRSLRQVGGAWLLVPSALHPLCLPSTLP